MEAMPPIEIYFELDNTADVTSIGSYRREQLELWFAGNDRIERETEQFDAGDMLKLKKFARGGLLCLLG